MPTKAPSAAAPSSQLRAQSPARQPARSPERAARSPPPPATSPPPPPQEVSTVGSIEDNSTALQAVVELLHCSPRVATARIAAPDFEELVCTQASPRVLRMLDHVGSRLERRGDAAGARSLGVIRRLAEAPPSKRLASPAVQSSVAVEPEPEPAEPEARAGLQPDDATMRDQATKAANARGFYRLLYKEVRAGRDHSEEVDGDIATGRAMDRVLGMLRSEEGRWAAIASRLDFVYLLCSQASPQLLSMLEHNHRRASRAHRIADADAISSLVAAVHATLNGVTAENPGNIASPLQSLHSPTLRQPAVGQPGQPPQQLAGAQNLESALNTVTDMASQLASSPFGSPHSDGFVSFNGAAAADEMFGQRDDTGLELDALVSEALQTWGGDGDDGDAAPGESSSGLGAEDGNAGAFVAIGAGNRQVAPTAPTPVAHPVALHSSRAANAASHAATEGTANPSAEVMPDGKAHAAVSRRSPPRRKARRTGSSHNTASAPSAPASAPVAATQQQPPTRTVTQVQPQSSATSTNDVAIWLGSAQTQPPQDAEPERRRARRSHNEGASSGPAAAGVAPAGLPTDSDPRSGGPAPAAAVAPSAAAGEDTLPIDEQRPQPAPEPEPELEPEPEPEPELEPAPESVGPESVEQEPEPTRAPSAVALALAAAPAPVAAKTNARESLAQRAERLKAEREQKAKSTPALLALQDEAGQSRAAALKADPSKPSPLRARPGGSDDRVNHVLAAGLAMHPGSAPPASVDRLADGGGSEVALAVQVPDDDDATDDYFAGGADDSDDDDLHAQIMALG